MPIHPSAPRAMLWLQLVVCLYCGALLAGVLTALPNHDPFAKFHFSPINWPILQVDGPSIPHFLTPIPPADSSADPSLRFLTPLTPADSSPILQQLAAMPVIVGLDLCCVAFKGSEYDVVMVCKVCAVGFLLVGLCFAAESALMGTAVTELTLGCFALVPIYFHLGATVVDEPDEHRSELMRLFYAPFLWICQVLHPPQHLPSTPPLAAAPNAAHCHAHEPCTVHI